MREKRAGMSAIHTDIGILVVGGILENFEITPTCELYDISQD